MEHAPNRADVEGMRDNCEEVNCWQNNEGPCVSEVQREIFQTTEKLGRFLKGE